MPSEVLERSEKTKNGKFRSHVRMDEKSSET